MTLTKITEKNCPVRKLMPLTFLKIKKGKERFCNWKFCQMWAVVWSDVVRSLHLWVSTDSEQKQGREKQIESKSPPCPSAHPPLLIWSSPQKLIFFFWEAKVYTESLDCQRVRSGLLLFRKKPLNFFITLDLSTFLFSLCFTQTFSSLF